MTLTLESKTTNIGIYAPLKPSQVSNKISDIYISVDGQCSAMNACFYFPKSCLRRHITYIYREKPPYSTFMAIAISS